MKRSREEDSGECRCNDKDLDEESRRQRVHIGPWVNGIGLSGTVVVDNQGDCNRPQMVDDIHYMHTLTRILYMSGFSIIKKLGKGTYCTAFEIKKIFDNRYNTNLAKGMVAVARVSTESRLNNEHKYGEEFVNKLAIDYENKFRDKCPLLPDFELCSLFNNTFSIRTEEEETKSFWCVYSISIMPLYCDNPVRDIPEDMIDQLDKFLSVLSVCDYSTVHGDLKRANILWDPITGYPIIIDWDFTEPGNIWDEIKCAVDPFNYGNTGIQKIQMNEKWNDTCMKTEELWLKWFLISMMQYVNTGLRKDVKNCINNEETSTEAIKIVDELLRDINDLQTRAKQYVRVSPNKPKNVSYSVTELDDDCHLLNARRNVLITQKR